MLKVVNWKSEAEKATKMTDSELAFARKDAGEAAKLWDGGADPDGNNGFYLDQCSVYATEQHKRAMIRQHGWA
jgi:hypothetical protein